MKASTFVVMGSDYMGSAYFVGVGCLLQLVLRSSALPLSGQSAGYKNFGTPIKKFATC
jgi:hypothetical protein